MIALLYFKDLPFLVRTTYEFLDFGFRGVHTCEGHYELWLNLAVAQARSGDV